MSVSMSFIMENYKVVGYGECVCWEDAALYDMGDAAVCIHCARASVAREQAKSLEENIQDLGAVANKFFAYTDSLFK